MSSSASTSRKLIPMSNKYDRVVLLIDMDCFYCQVEEKLNDSLKGQPMAVVQYNTWRGGGIIAVNYAARAKGVTRHMRGDEAKAQCPEIQLVQVPNVRDKGDLTKYREAGKDVANVLQRFTALLERASVDEAYLDITESVNNRFVEMNEGTFVLQPTELVSTYAVGYETIGEFVKNLTTSYMNPSLDNDYLLRNFHESDIPAARTSNIRLLIAASIASEIRAAVKAETSYECSAGIAHNKILAKLACGMNKPNKQTILPLSQIDALFETLPVGKIKGLGAKYGEDICERLGVRYLGQLLKFTESELQTKFDDKNGSWLYNICRGIDLEPVTPRFYSKSIGCCKKFPGRNSITGIKTLQHWLKELANEIIERLQKDTAENNRRAKQMVVSFIQEVNSEEISSSRSTSLTCYDPDVVAHNSLEIIKLNTKQFFRSGSESLLYNPIKFLGISAGKFETISHSQNKIQDMFAQQAAKLQKSTGYKQQADIEASIAHPNSTTCNTIKIEETSKLPNQKNKNDVKTLFANALKNQTKQSPIENLLDSHAEKPSSVKRINNEPEVSQSSPKSFFKKRLKNVQQNQIQPVIIEEEKSKQHPMAEKCLISTEPAQTQDKLHNMQESHNKQYTCENDTASQYDNTDELDDLVLVLESMQNESNKQVCMDKNEKQQATDVTPPNISCSKRKFKEISENEPSCSHNQAENSTNKNCYNDYKAEYVEFAAPELRPELLQFTTCSKCSVEILNDPFSLQTHEDYHFAHELCQSERLEFREQVQSRLNKTSNSPNNTSKKSKKSPINNSKKGPLNENITKFLRPSLPPSITTSANSATEICEICKLAIKLDKVAEHKDFHVAKDLHRKLNQMEVHTVEIAKKPNTETTRRNVGTSFFTSRQSTVNKNPITQYFAHPNT